MTGTAASLNRVDGSWIQTGILTFSRDITGADRAWQIVTEVAPLTIPRAGLWVIDFQVRGMAFLPANPGPTFTALGVTAGIHKNGAPIVGSEVMAVYKNEHAGNEGGQVQATGSRQFLHGFAAGDTVELAAFRLGQVGQASVFSNGDGRTYITGHWIAPTGDGPS